MSEELICSKSPSQVLNIRAFFSATIIISIIVSVYVVGKEKLQLPPYFLALIIFPVITSVWRYMQIKCQKYELTTERLRVISGVLNRSTDEIELYRIKDFSLTEPFMMRIFKLGDIFIESSDKSMPYLKIKALPRAAEFKEHLRACVEEIRQKKNVREVDFE